MRQLASEFPGNFPEFRQYFLGCRGEIFARGRCDRNQEASS